MKNDLIAWVGKAARSTRTIRCLSRLVVVLGLLASAVGSPCQVNRRTQQIPRALPPPCCSITAINTSTGVVTAKVNANGNVFQFQVTNTALLNSLKVGQGVYANFPSKQVSLDGTTVCCNILAPPAPPPPVPPAGGAPPPAPSKPATSLSAAPSAATSSAATSSGADLQRLSQEFPAPWVALTPSAAVCAKVGWGFKDNACYTNPNSSPPPQHEEGGGSGGTPEERCHNKCQQGADNLGVPLWFSGVELDGTCTCGFIYHGLYIVVSHGHYYSTGGGQASGPQSRTGAGIANVPTPTLPPLGGSSSSGRTIPGIQKETISRWFQIGKEPAICETTITVDDGLGGHKTCTLSSAVASPGTMTCYYECASSKK